MENRRDGHYSGTQLSAILVSDSDRCENLCCENPECKLWVFRKRDSICHQKSDDNLVFNSNQGHISARKIDESSSKLFGGLAI